MSGELIGAKATRQLYVRLPAEDHEPGMVGRLNQSMYGTRDAAYNWEMDFADFFYHEWLAQELSSPVILCILSGYSKSVFMEMTSMAWDLKIICYGSKIAWTTDVKSSSEV